MNGNYITYDKRVKHWANSYCSYMHWQSQVNDIENEDCN